MFGLEAVCVWRTVFGRMRVGRNAGKAESSRTKGFQMWEGWVNESDSIRH